ncbi:MAG TPA: hypothetical protein PK685_01705 [archaeon]|nr:hypothetical protein [archaeon]
MAKIIDFEEAKKRLDLSNTQSNKSKKYYQYIKEQEHKIDSISEMILKKLREVYVCENPNEHLLRIKEMKMLTAAFNSLLTKIEKAGIQTADKILLKRRIQEQTEKIETIRKAYEDLINEIYRTEPNFQKAIKEKKDKKRKAIRVNTRRNVK